MPEVTSRRHPMAYEVKDLAPGVKHLGIFKQGRVLAMAGKDAKQGEIIGMAAAPVMARAIVAVLKAVTVDERAAARVLCEEALRSAGVANEG